MFRASAAADEVAPSGGGGGSWSSDGTDGEPVTTLANSAAPAVRQARAFTSGCREESSGRLGEVHTVPLGLLYAVSKTILQRMLGRQPMVISGFPCEKTRSLSPSPTGTECG